MPEPRTLKATFRKQHKPVGIRVSPLTASEISEFEDCCILRGENENPVGVEVQTTEGTLEIGMNEGWIFEDADGEHYPISDEAVDGMYEVTEILETAPF